MLHELTCQALATAWGCRASGQLDIPSEQMCTAGMAEIQVRTQHLGIVPYRNMSRLGIQYPIAAEGQHNSMV
jgi:hypothetical protein